MSPRATVSLGVWILAMVLMGTMTVGANLGFYVGLTALSALAVGALSAVSRRRAARREGSESCGMPASMPPPGPSRAERGSRAVGALPKRSGSPLPRPAGEEGWGRSEADASP